MTDDEDDLKNFSEAVVGGVSMEVLLHIASESEEHFRRSEAAEQAGNITVSEEERRLAREDLRSALNIMEEEVRRLGKLQGDRDA